jgi:protease-4
VGVIFQWAEVSQLLDKLGIKMTEIKSGPLKANPSMFQPIDEAGRAVAEQMVAESKRWFVGLVATRRGIDTASIAGLEQGRVFSGREALTFKLIDQIGGEQEAVKYLEEQRSVPKGLKVVDWKPKRESNWGVLDAVPSACSRCPPVGSGRERSNTPMLSRPRNPPLKRFFPSVSFRFTHHVKFSNSF